MKKLLLLIILSCSYIYSYTPDTDFTAKFEKQSVYGTWIDIDSAKEVEINSKTNFTFETLDHDIILKTQAGKKSYLKRIGASKTLVSGRVAIHNGSEELLTAKNVTLTMFNEHDPSIRTTIRTNKSGYFSNETLPSGSYIITSSYQGKSFKATVRLMRKNEALGTFILKDKNRANFKSTLHLEGSFLISDTQNYQARLEIQNYGDLKGSVCYKASINDPKLKRLAFKDSCKTVAPNASFFIPITISFNPITINSVRKVLDVHLTDAKGQKTLESHPLMVYKNRFDLTLTTPLSSIKGYVILPNQELIKIDPRKKRLNLPKLSNLDYQLIIANTNARQATKYGVDIGAEEKLWQGYTKDEIKKQDQGFKSLSDASTNQEKTFYLKQTIGRYPQMGDIAVYAFKVADSITLQEDARSLRIPYLQRNHLGDIIDYKLSLSDPSLATVSYQKGFITVTPRPNAYGIATLTLKNKSGATFGTNNIKNFTLTVTSVNDKPVITSKPLRSIVDGDTYRYTLKAKDLESKQLTLWAQTLPSWLKFSSKKNLLYGKPSAKDIGKHRVTLKVKDDTDTVSQSFLIQVIAKEKPKVPVFASYQGTEDTVLSGLIQTVQKEDDVILFSLNKTPEHGKVVVKNDGAFIYTPKENFNGNDIFSANYSVNGKIKPLLISLDIKSVNDAPKADDIIINPVGSTLQTIDWLKRSKASDIDEDDLFIEIKSKTALGTLTLDNDKLLYTPYPDKQGSEKVLLNVFDKQGGQQHIWLYLYNVERGITPKVFKTGQTIIYHHFDDGVYQKSLPRVYEKDLNGKVVKDMINLKTWFHEAAPVTRTLKEAQEFCSDLEVDDVGSWHLPAIEDLVLLSDKGRKSPAIDPSFKGVKNDYYWSSTPYKDRPQYQWVLYFDYGEDYYRHTDDAFYTLCVHDSIDDLAKPLAENFDDANRTYVLSTKTDSGKEGNSTLTSFIRDDEKAVVTDKRQELMWDDAPLHAPKTWISAISYCEAHDRAGFSNWRVPNFNELYSISRHDADKKATHEVFRQIKNAAFWSATSSEQDHDRAWGISFVKGSDFTFDKTEEIYVRCVRDLK